MLRPRSKSFSSGLASCLTAGVAAVAQRRGIQLHSVKASLEADMDIQGILGIDDDVRNGFGAIRVHFDIRADASEDDIKALVAQSQKRSAVFDIITNPTERLRHGQLIGGWMRRSECREICDRDHHRRRPIRIWP